MLTLVASAAASVVVSSARPPVAAAAYAPAPRSLQGPQHFLVVGCAMADSGLQALNRATPIVTANIDRVRQYFRIASNNHINFSADFIGWSHLPLTGKQYKAKELASGDWTALRQDCATIVKGVLIDTGKTLSSYDGYVSLFSYDPDADKHDETGYVGLPSQGGAGELLTYDGQPASRDCANCAPWVRLRFDGGFAGGWTSEATWVHELGHAFGLSHSPDRSVPGTDDYNNPWDVMSDLSASTEHHAFDGGTVCNSDTDPGRDGDGYDPHQCASPNSTIAPQDLAAFQKDLLGWLNPATETVTQTYGAAAYQLTAPQYDPTGATPNVRVIKVPVNLDSGAGGYYSIEYKRTSLAGDADLPASSAGWVPFDIGLAGPDRVLVYQVKAGVGVLVAALREGQAFSSPNARINIWFNSHVNGLRMAANVSVGVFDDVPPRIYTGVPAAGQEIYQNTSVPVSYVCRDQLNGAALAYCTGTVPAGQLLDTSILGQHSFAIEAADRAGNAAIGVHFSYTVVPDLARPTVDIAVPVPGAQFLKGSLVNASYTCSDVGTGLGACDADVANGSPLDTSTAGSHYFTVTALDRAGLITRVVVPYTVYADTSKPTITITTPAQGATYRKGQILHAAFTCGDESGGSGLTSCTGTTPDNGLIDTTRVGRHTLRVTALDNAGNRRTQTVAYRVVPDKTKPTIFIFAPTDGAAYRVGQLPTFEFSCNDDPYGQVLSDSCVGNLDGQPVATGSQASLPDIPAGPHTWRVDATDLAGNTASTTVHFTVNQ